MLKLVILRYSAPVNGKFSCVNTSKHVYSKGPVSRANVSKLSIRHNKSIVHRIVQVLRCIGGSLKHSKIFVILKIKCWEQTSSTNGCMF